MGDRLAGLVADAMGYSDNGFALRGDGAGVYAPGFRWRLPGIQQLIADRSAFGGAGDAYCRPFRSNDRVDRYRRMVQTAPHLFNELGFGNPSEVVGFFDPPVQYFSKSLHHSPVPGIVGHIMKLVGILCDHVQFLDVTGCPEPLLLHTVEGAIVAMAYDLAHQVLPRAVGDVLVRGQVRVEVSYVTILFIPHRTHPVHRYIHSVARAENIPSRFAGLIRSGEGLALHMFRRLNAGEGKHRRREVNEADQVGNDRTRIPFVRIADDERRPQATVCYFTFEKRKTVSVIGPEKNDGVIHFSGRFEFSHSFTHPVVHLGNVRVEARNIASYAVGVRIKGWNLNLIGADT